MGSNERTRTWLMKSRIFLISLVTVVVPSMNLINNAVVLKSKKKNFRLHLKKLKQLWNKKKIRCFEHNLNWDKSAKKSIAKSKRKKKNLIILAKIINEQWTHWVLLWKQNNAPRLKHSELRRNLNLTSTN